MLDVVREWVQDAQHICVLTGAGISAESGVPTFREAQTGYWALHRPEDMASEAGFRANPELVWSWYEHRRQLVAAVKPNAAHYALAQFEQSFSGKFSLVTQNVDGLHQQAGSSATICLHGELQKDQWLEPAQPCCVDAETHQSFAQTIPPRCSVCGNLRRPAVVWFGERLPSQALALAEEAASRCDLMFVIGTAGVVYPAAGLVFQAREQSARIVIVNTTQTELDALADFVVTGTASKIVPAIFGVTL